MVDHITSIDALHSIYGDAAVASIDKQLVNSTFTALLSKIAIYGFSTVGDVSPKGDHPGFVKVLNGKTWKIRPQR